MKVKIDDLLEAARRLFDSRRDTLARLSRTRHPKHLQRLEEALRTFSPGERLLLYVLSATLALSTFVLLDKANALISLTIPARGGSLVEGDVGPARFINPLLALSQPDQDIAALVYSGLTRELPDGSFAPDLASSYEISTDGTTYTFHLRPDATFQDGSRVSAADIVFTVKEAQNPDIGSSRRADWEGVTLSSPNPETVVFTLPHAYAPFIANTTLGILPEHLWKNTPTEEFPFSPLNTHPLGSGPYQVSRVVTDSTGAAVRYDLVPFQRFTLGSPHIAKISFALYSNADLLARAFNEGAVDAIAGIDPSALPSLKREDVVVLKSPLPRVFGVFFNEAHAPVLSDTAVREALDKAIDKQHIVDSVLGGFGSVLDGPIPPGALEAQVVEDAASGAAATSTSLTSLSDAARAILQKGGWTFDQASGVWKKNKKTLSISLATADVPELVKTAREVVADWQRAGIRASVQVYPLPELNSGVIRPRSYDALLFGEIVGPELDLFAFWHSSQRNDPGLNLALYANSKTDALLKEARETTSASARAKLYERFAALLQKDTPAVFLYAPDFLYVLPKNIEGVSLGSLTTPSDRFSELHRWYIDTERVWNVFAPESALTTNTQ